MRMDSKESLSEVSRLRLRFKMNNRLRLESLAALSKVFREYGEPVSDELLSSLVLALPEEVQENGTRAADKQYSGVASTDVPPPGAPRPGVPPPGAPGPDVPRPGIPPPGTGQARQMT